MSDAALAAAAFEAVEEKAWRVRKGAALALGGVGEGSQFDSAAVEALISLLRDEHADVRRAAVIGLTPRVGQPDVDRGLAEAADDSDADVRAYARRVVSGG
jgi:HEAT repeat protein